MFLAMNPGTVVAVVSIIVLFVLLLIFISRIRIVKKNIARVKTALNQKKIAGIKE